MMPDRVIENYRIAHALGHVAVEVMIRTHGSLWLLMLCEALRIRGVRHFFAAKVYLLQ